MPELPEVETIRRYLQAVLVGQAPTGVRHLDPRLIRIGDASAAEIAEAMRGVPIAEVGRRGKYLWLRFPRQGFLVLHLGMSGRLLWEERHRPWVKHTHLVVGFPQDQELRLVDPRRFGRVGWLPALLALEDKLGVEPLGPRFTAEYLARHCHSRRAPIKAVLLDQSVVAGLGNIYADEALFASAIHPARAACALADGEVARLRQAIRRVLRRALKYRGTSFSDYVDALGHPGENQHYLAVYGRRGHPCPRCGAPVAVVQVAGRSSHFCPACQPIGDGGAEGALALYPNAEERDHATV